jgi:asparagine synthase (glutamine-hydrolysing)
MCGIAGKISFTNRPVEKRDIKHMTDAIAHRGPDDEGVFISPDEHIGLGHRRLSIIDLSSHGHQPMSYLGRYQIVFNGEIYNFQEKRRLLEREGYRFKSKTDTEVILALYDKFGPECLQHLRGMFAFAIYDSQNQQLFCARDRIGQKPFKYYLDSSGFIFASELKAILTQPEYSKQPDYTAIHHYLTLQYCPAPLTGFKNIKKLEPAHYLLINTKTGQMGKERYWRLDYSRKQNLSEPNWQQIILDKLKESVKLRLISDVPLGAFLSGGIDSSAIVALMSELSNRPVKTFSIGFDEKDYNELPYARQIADRYHTDHTEFKVKPNAIDLLPLLVRHYEEPYADSSALPTYYLSQLTRQHVTVALNGDGGDENFAGYGRYSVQRFALAYEKVRVLNQLVAVPAARLAAHAIPNTLLNRANRFAATLNDNYARRYVNYICYFSNQQKRQLYTDDFFQQVWAADTYDIISRQFTAAETPDKLDQTLYADFTTYLPDDLLVKVDIDTMATSLEARSPFLDHEFLELTAQIPSQLKLKGANNKKYILKQALRKYLSPEILNRPKMGFGVPIEHWFRTSLKPLAYSTLLDQRSRNRGLFRTDRVKNLLDLHCQTNINYANHLWALLTLEFWFQEYFD